jgi:predicted alpha-1,6-mannanase (GH76 family)
LIEKIIRSIRLRNGLKWTNNYYDDMAWLGLALRRAQIIIGSDVEEPLGALVEQLHLGWSSDAGGGIWWRRGDLFKNAPANGPASILHARCGEMTRARALNSWMESTLVDRETGLVWDGFRVDTGNLEKQIYTYCQGVFIGSCLELSRLDSATRVIQAVAKFCAKDKVIKGQNGGDGGLFAAILARYLALAARSLKGEPAAAVARDLVMASAESCWDKGNHSAKYPLFHHEWSDEAPLFPMDKENPDRDLSVQLGAWMLFEAAASL